MISIIVTTYNAPEKLDRCLRSFRKVHPDVAYELIVSFDAGPDLPSTEAVAKEHGAKLVVAELNSGFGSAVNRAVRQCSPDSTHILLVNDDLWFEVPVVGTILATFQKEPSVAIVGARLLYPDGTVQHAGIGTDVRHIGVGLAKDDPLVVQTRPAFAVTGALFGVVSAFMRQCGGFDEAFQMAWEDVDLCLTATVLGWKVWYCGEAWAFHEEGGTRGRTSEELAQHPKWYDWHVKGEQRFKQKWASTISQLYPSSSQP